MRTSSAAFGSRFLRARNVWLWPGAILALLLAAPAAEPADPVLSRLDARLQVLYHAQAEAQAQGFAAEADARGRALLGRLQEPRSRLAASASPRLSLLVKHRGDRKALAAGGFRIDSCLGTICAGTLPLRRLSAFAARPEVEFVQASSMLRASVPLGPVARPALAPAPRAAAQTADAPQGDQAGTGVLIAFVDTGVDVRHQDFRNDDGTTRVKALLDLSYPGDLDGDGDLDGPGPYGGTLYTEAQINAALQGGPSVAQKDTTGHGTHGLSVAAGDDAAIPGVAPEADLLVVKATREDGTLGFVSADVVNALAWIDATATTLGHPCVINLSLGTVVGSHDGRSLEEQAIDALTGPGRPGRVAVIAAGNSSDNRPGTRFRHFSDNALVGIPRTHTLEVPAYTPGPAKGDDRIVLDLWYSGSDRLKLTVTSPNGHVVTAAFGEYLDQETADGNVFVANLGGANAENGDIESLVVIDDWAGTPPAVGTWTIAVEAEQVGADGEYHAWLADDSAVGAAAPWLSGEADNLFLVGKPGTALHGITVGSYAWDDPGTRFLTQWTDVHGLPRTDATAIVGDISDFSSPGRTRDGRLKPDLAAPGERLLGAVSGDAYPGVAPSSVYRYHGFEVADALVTSNAADNAFGVLQGTSFSAPVVTGLVARILADAPTLDAAQVRNALLNATAGDSYTGAVPNEVWGWGKVSLTVGGAPLPATLRIDTEALPAVVVGEPYQYALTASGGTPPYTWSITAGTLPAGLTIDGHGLIAGTPTDDGSSPITVSVADAAARSATRDLTLTVESGWALEIVTTVLPPARVDKPYDAELEARGGTPPYTWALGGASVLPPGLTLDAAGRVLGTPTTLGRFDFTLEVTDAAAGAAARAVRIRVSQDSSELWDPLGLAETQVNKVSVDPADGQHLFASTRNAFDSSQDALFETTDAGETWRPISINNNFNGSAEDLTVSPATSEPWAVRHYDGVHLPELFRYDPATAAWVDTNLCSAGNPTIDGLAIDPAGAVYGVGQTCTGTSGDVRKSTSQGASWTTVGTLCGGVLSSTYAPGSLAVAATDPNRLYATRAGYQSSAYTSFTCRSVDGGASWTTLPGTLSGSGNNYLDVQVSQADAADVLRGVREMFDHSVERSLDGGDTWDRYEVTGAGGFACCMRRAPGDPAVVLYGTSMGLHKSENHGVTWTRLSVKGDSGLEVTSLAFDPVDPDIFYVGSTDGVFRTTDGGETWTLRSRGLVRRGLSGLAQSSSAPGDVLIGTTAGTPYVSRTGGERWTSTGVGLSGFDVRYPVISSADPNLFLIHGDLTGLFRSNDRGVSWTQVTSTSTCTFCWAVQAVDADPFDANVIVIGISGRDLYRSGNRGQTWVPVAEELGNPKDLSFARGLQGTGRVYAAMGPDGMARSDDHGLTWAIVYQDGTDMRVVEPAPSDARRVLAASPTQVYYRDPVDYSGGSDAANWHPATTSPARPVLSLGVEWGDPLVAYAGVDHPGTAGSFGGIYKTTDGGHTWVRVPGVLDAYDVVSVVTHPTTPGTVLAATAEGGVFRSTNGGQTWTPLDRYATVGELVNVTVKHPSSSLLFAGTEGYGVQVSTDGGRSFTSRITGLTNLDVNAIAFEPDSATVMYAATDGGLFKSTDAGNTWTATAVTGEVTDLATDNEGTARRIWGTVKGQGVAYSDNAGGVFNLYSSGLASLELTSLALEQLDGGARRIWGTTKGGDGVVFSSDLGITWQAAAGTGLADRNLNDFTFESGAARRIWGTARRIWGTGDSGVFYSDDDGLTWSEMPLGLPSAAPVTSISIDPNTNEAFLSLFSDLEGGVYRGGNTAGVWKPFVEGLDELKVRRITNDGGHSLGGGAYATTFYAATAGDGTYKTDVQTAAGEDPVIGTVALPGATVHQAYTATLAATGGAPPYAWSVPEGFLPPGLTLEAGTGAIGGLPGAAGVFAFAVQVADSQGRLDRQDLSITVSELNFLTVTLTSVGGGTVTSSPAGIDCGSDCSETYAGGLVVTLTATPDAGAAFGGWGGDCSGTDPCVLTMNAPRSVTARFTYALTVTRAGTGTGTVTSLPAGIDCGASCAADHDAGTVVSLTATPAPDATFTGWSGACIASPCTVTMTAARAVTATFTQKPAGENVVGQITRPGLKPSAVAVYEAGNRVFVADDITGTIYIYDGTTLAELGSLKVSAGSSVARQVNKMVVHEGSGKLYAAIHGTGQVAVINAATGALIRYLLGTYNNYPQLALDPTLGGAGKLYVLALQGLFQVDVATDAVTSIPGLGGGQYESLAVNTVTHEAFVTRYIANTLVVVNGTTLGITTVDGPGGIGIAVNPAENKVYVALCGADAQGGATFCIHDRDTGVTTSANVDNDATELLYNPVSNRMYSDSEVNGVASILEGPTDAFFNLPLPSATGALAVRQATNHVYGAGQKFTAIVDDATQLVEMVPVNNPTPGSTVVQDIAINQTTGRVFVLNDNVLNFVTVLQDDPKLGRPPLYLGSKGSFPYLHVLDPVVRAIVDTRSAPVSFQGTHSLAPRPGGGRLYVPPLSTYGSGLEIFAGSGQSWLLDQVVTGVYGTSKGSAVAAVTPDGSRVYVTNSSVANVSVIDPEAKSVTTTVTVGSTPFGIAITPDGAKVYVANQGGNSVSVISTASNTVTSTIPVGASPWGVAVNPSGTEVYVANSGAATVSVIDTATDAVVATVPVGTTPHWLAVTPDGQQVFVGNRGASSVSVIGAATNTVIDTLTGISNPEGIVATPDGREILVVNNASSGSSSITAIQASDHSKTTHVLTALGASTDTTGAIGLGIADPTSRIAGRVTQGGAPVAGILVRALQGGAERGTATSDAAGDYSIFDLLPGTYDVEVVAPGGTLSYPGQTVAAGRTVLIHPALTTPKPLTVIAPMFGTITGDGINCGTGGIDCTETYPHGTEVTLTATPAEGYSLAGWTIDCSGTGSCVLIMDEEHTVGASFSLTQYALTVTKAGTGSGTVTSVLGGIDCGSDCFEAYLGGTSVTLTAAAATGSVFSGWGGACSGSATTCPLTMDAPKAVTAEFSLPEPVTWTHDVGLSVSGNTATKVAGTSWDAGGVSTKGIASGNGYVEFVATSTSGSWMAGLGKGDESTSFTDVEYAVFLHSDGGLHVYEGGTYQGYFGSYAASDRFRVGIEEGVVRYRRNGEVFFESPTGVGAESYPLTLDASLNVVGSVVGEAVIAGVLVEVWPLVTSPPVNVSWTHDMGVELNGNSLTKVLGYSWDAGAVSTKGIASGNGYVEFDATDTTGIWMAGLGSGDSGVQFPDIEYGLFLYEGNLLIYEGGTYHGFFGSYQASDRFRVGVEDGVVRYRRNGVVFYESPTLVSPEQYPLVLDTSVYEVGSTVGNAVMAGTLVDVWPPLVSAPVNVQWTHDVGVTLSGNSLTKVLGLSWDAGAVSTKGIGSGNGYVEFDATDTTGIWMAGLGTGDTGVTFPDIEYGLFLYEGSLLIYEGGVYHGFFGSYVATDRLRVGVEDGVVRYRKNGVVFYESPNLVGPGQYPLVLDTSVYEVGSTVGNAVMAGSLVDVWPVVADQPVDVVWTHDLGMTVSGSNLTKALGVSWDAGAVSTKGIASGNGYVEFSAVDTTGAWMAGLGTGDTSRFFPDLEYGLFLYEGSLLIYEGGSYRGFFGSYAPSDRFRVGVEDGVVRYRHNGVVFFESPTLVGPGQYPLVLDTSFYAVGSTLGSAVISGTLVDVWPPLMATPVAVEWTRIAGGAEASGSSLVKLSGGGWDTGAVSSQGLSSGNGYVEFGAVDTAGSWMAGLGSGDTGVEFTDIEYGVFLHLDGSVHVYEAGAYRGMFGSYLAGDRIRVGVEDGVVRYRRNGVAFYESLTPPSPGQYPFVLDTALNAVGSTVGNATLAGALTTVFP